MVVTISQSEKNPVGALLSNLTWETLEKLDGDLAETGAQLTYLDGCLEIISPLSDAHEEPKNTPNPSKILSEQVGVKIHRKGNSSSDIERFSLLACLNNSP